MGYFMEITKEFRHSIAAWIAPERAQALRVYGEKLAKAEEIINQRVAMALMQMDPFEPFMKKYHGIFSKEYERVEDKLDEPSQIHLFTWAYGIKDSPEFKYLTDWILNTQGNNTVRRAKTEFEWFYGRAAIATIMLFIDEVSRLASKYQDILARKDQEFNSNVTVE